MKIEYPLSEDIMNNMYQQYKNVFVIESKVNLKVDDRIVGIVRMCIDVTGKKKYIKVGQYVTFSESKIKWRNNPINRHFVTVVNSFWVKPYVYNPKLPVVVKVQTSVSNLQNPDERIYNIEFEEIEMSYNQYIKRCMIQDYYSHDYGEMMAYDNYKELLGRTNDYWYAVNTTAKQYCIEHEKLISLKSAISNSKKKYKKQWLEYRSQYQENKIIEHELDEMFEDMDDKPVAGSNAKVFYLDEDTRVSF